MRVALVHTVIEEAGGGEVLSLKMYDAIRRLGHSVDYFTTYVDRRAWSLLKDTIEDPRRQWCCRPPGRAWSGSCSGAGASGSGG
ncbi:hypothetical protein [Acidilobus sp.]|uniref:hypothetical protein n=1 Tax=Acidilobus sp. TaxID=1872109 RepID=UPI003D008911